MNAVNVKEGFISNSTIEFLQDVFKEIVRIKSLKLSKDLILNSQHLVNVKAAKSLNASDYVIPVFNTNLDICRVGQGIKSSIFTRTMLENFDKAAEYKVDCPYRKVMRRS